ncbi:hypothetical protein T11_10423, partial [Trichinella zimbabwensis]
LTYVASGSIVKRSMSSFKAFSNYGSPFSIVENRGRHEADRGRHEAELWNEDIRYMRFPMDPNSVSLG